MKTLILYATKYGATREIAERLAKHLPDATICDLKSNDLPSLSQYDCIIIGSSLYAGQVRKEVKTFSKKEMSNLRGKRIGLFLSGLGQKQENHDNYFNINFPAELLDAACAKAFLGGVFDPQKAGGMDKLIYKLVAKQSEYVSRIFDDEIADFVRTLDA